MHLHAHVVHVLNGDVIGIDALVAEDSPRLRLFPVADVRKVLVGVQRVVAGDLGEVVEQVAAAGLQVHPLEVGVAIRLQVTLNVRRSLRSDLAHPAVVVVVGEETLGVRPRTIGLQGRNLAVGEGHELDVGRAGREAIAHAVRLIDVRRHGNLLELHVLTSEVGDLEECFRQLHATTRLGVDAWREMQVGEAALAAELRQQVAAPLVQLVVVHHLTDRDRVPAAHAEGQGHGRRRRVVARVEQRAA